MHQVSLFDKILSKHVTLRPWTPDDYNFCQDTYRLSASKLKALKRVKRDYLMAGLNQRFAQWSSFANVQLAVHKTEGEPFYGWIAYTPLQTTTIIWFVYTKHAFRKMGLCRHMVKECINPEHKLVYPFSTRVSDPVARRLDVLYNPFVYDEICLSNLKDERNAN